MATIKVMLNKNWKRKTGTYPIVIQILHKRKKKVINTGCSVFESDFDVEKQKVSHTKESTLSGREVSKINHTINKMRKEIISTIDSYEAQGIDYSVSDLGNSHKKRDVILFLEYMDSQIKAKRDAGLDGIADAYKSTRNSFSHFLHEKDVSVSEITPKLIREYADTLSGSGVEENTISYYMRNLKTIYNRIVADGFKPSCVFPFKAIKTTIGITPKRAIKREELKKIARLEFVPIKEAHLELARDIFMFSFYCQGTAFVDVIRLKKSNIVAGEIIFSRQKSKQPIRIAIIQQIVELMDKYRNNTEYVFPILDIKDSRPLYTQYKLALQRINYGLNIVGERVGLGYPLTTYIARHTWATLVKELGTPIPVISKGLGHSTEKTTKIYLKEFDTSVLDEVNKKVAKFD